MFLQSFFTNHPLLITSGAFVLITDFRQGRDLSYEIHTFTSTDRQVERRGSSYQAGWAATRDQPLLLEVRGSAWKRLHEDASRGERAIRGWALVGTRTLSRKCQSKEGRPSFACLQCCSSWLLLGSS